MKVITTELPGVLIFEPRVFADERGFFLESFNQRVFDEAVGAHSAASVIARGPARRTHSLVPR